VEETSVRWLNYPNRQSTYRTTFTHFPSISNLKLDNAYTIFRPEFPISKNVLLEKLFGVADWKGDVLVVKHPYDDLDHIVDIQERDKALVDLIVKMCIFLSQYPHCV
jgi:hypothetical protein